MVEEMIEEDKEIDKFFERDKYERKEKRNFIKN